jgi:hypothetical protein
MTQPGRSTAAGWAAWRRRRRRPRRWARGHVPGQQLLGHLEGRPPRTRRRPRHGASAPGVGHVAVQRAAAPASSTNCSSPAAGPRRPAAPPPARARPTRHRRSASGSRPAASGPSVRPPSTPARAAPAAAAAHAPDGVERAVDGQHQRQRRGHQQHQAQRAHAARPCRELRQRAQHRPRDAVGHQVLQEVLLQRPWKPNIGKAVNTASITVTSGTSAISVVKVRLPAVRPRRSSRSARAACAAVSNQGQCAASAAARQRAARRQGQPCIRPARGTSCWL